MATTRSAAATAAVASKTGGATDEGAVVAALGAGGRVPRRHDFRYSMDYLPHTARHTLASFCLDTNPIGGGMFGAYALLQHPSICGVFGEGAVPAA